MEENDLVLTIPEPILDSIQDDRIEILEKLNEEEIIDSNKHILPISIVIPCYNSGLSLPLVMRSIYESNKLPIEVIIVDDCSTIPTIPIIRNFKCTYIRLKQNSGPAIARNTGAKIATGKYLLFIDDDIELQKDSMDIIFNDFKTNDNYSAVVGLLSYKHPNKDLLSRYKNFYMFFSLSNSPKYFGCLYTSISAIKRDAFIELSGFDESHKRASVEDVDLGQRMVNRGKILHLNKNLMVVHYKKWNFRSFVKNEFIRSYDLLKMLIENKYAKKLFNSKRYLNNSPITLITTILSFLTLMLWALSFLSAKIILVNLFIVAFISLLNFRFIYRFSKYNSFKHVVLIPFIIYFDFSIASLGIVSSIIMNMRYIFKK